MPERPRGRLTVGVFAATAFLGASLLFVAEPLVAKLVAPRLRWVGDGLEHQLAVLPGAAARGLRLRAPVRPRGSVDLAACAPTWSCSRCRSSPFRGRLPPMRPRRRMTSPALWLLRTLAVRGRAAVRRGGHHRTAAAAVVLLERPTGARGPVLPVRREQPGQLRRSAGLSRCSIEPHLTWPPSGVVVASASWCSCAAHRGVRTVGRRSKQSVRVGRWPEAPAARPPPVTVLRWTSLAFLPSG